MTDKPTMTDDEFAALYPSLRDDMKCTIIFSRGALGFRYGPFPAKQVGAVMEKATDLGIPFLVSVEAGPEIDWNLALDLYGKGPAAAEEAAAKASASASEASS